MRIFLFCAPVFVNVYRSFFCCTITAFCFSFKLRTALLTALLVVVPGSEWGKGVFSNTRSSGFREFADKSCLRAPRLHVAAFLGKRGKLFRSVSRPGVLAVCSLKMYGSLGAPTSLFWTVWLTAATLRPDHLVNKCSALPLRVKF